MGSGQGCLMAAAVNWKAILLESMEVDTETGCWVWAKRVNKNGYAVTDIGGSSRFVHRISVEVFAGPIPEGMTVDHLCFNPPCVNPSHLRLLTLSENSRNQRSAMKTHCVNGHEYTPENTYIRPQKRRQGRRDCRQCIRDRVAKYAKRKAAA